MHRKPAWIAVISLLVLLSCANSSKIVFLNQTNRQNLNLEDKELKHLQFYISTNVLVQYDGPLGKKSILLQEATPGVVTAVGPDWLKVSFREGGADVPFVADSQGEYDVYSLATELPGQSRLPHDQKSAPESLPFQWHALPGHVWRQGLPPGRGERAAEVAEETHSYQGPSHVGPLGRHARFVDNARSNLAKASLPPVRVGDRFQPPLHWSLRLWYP